MTEKFWKKYLDSTLCEDDRETDYFMKQIICNLSNKRYSVDNYLWSDLNSTGVLLNKIKERQALGHIEDKKVTSLDNTNPEHYKKLNFETIELIQNVISDYPDAFLGYLVSNTIKYLMRFQYKGKPMEDLDKAIWYSTKARFYAEEKIVDKEIENSCRCTCCKRENVK